MQFYAIFFQLLYIIICVRVSRVCILSVMWSKERHPIASLCFSLFWYFMCRQFWNSPGTGKACGWVPRSGIGHCLWNGLCYEFNEHTNPCWQGYYQCALTHGDWFIVIGDWFIVIALLSNLPHTLAYYAKVHVHFWQPIYFVVLYTDGLQQTSADLCSDLSGGLMLMSLRRQPGACILNWICEIFGSSILSEYLFSMVSWMLIQPNLNGLHQPILILYPRGLFADWFKLFLWCLCTERPSPWALYSVHILNMGVYILYLFTVMSLCTLPGCNLEIFHKLLCEQNWS